jgi:hypothetical protein
MAQQKPEQHTTHCLLCTNQVQHQGDVCPQCEPRYIVLGKVLIEYASQIEPILKASPHKHIGAPMRFVPDVHFFLKELDTPVLYEGKMITHRLTTMSLTLDEANPLREDYWYGHNIPSTLMAATITASPTAMGFPEEPDYFVPIASWKAVSHGGGKPENKNAKRDKDDEL